MGRKANYQEYDDENNTVRQLRPKQQRYSADAKSAHLLEGKPIVLRHRAEPRTEGQAFYLQNLRENTVTMATGPAGTGKTWLATYHGLELLLTDQVQQIVLTKPILEAGEEKIGFLPGEVNDKIGPHFQSILDQIEDHIGPKALDTLISKGKIKLLPLAYRGRDIKHSFILVDEAQNITRKGMKLLLTRISEGSTLAVNGDADQIDLPRPEDSGLQWAVDRMRGVDADIGVVEMHECDIQRHRLIGVILRALR